MRSAKVVFVVLILLAAIAALFVWRISDRPLSASASGFTIRYAKGEDPQRTRAMFFEPQITNPEFERGVASGTICDFENELDPNTIKVILDVKTDLTDHISCLVLDYFDKGHDYNWQVDIPPEFIDGNEHYIDVHIKGNDGIEREYGVSTVFDPIIPLGIDFVVYPYVDIFKDMEDQDPPDSLRLLVALSGDIRPEWDEALKELDKAWSIDSLNEPISAEVRLQNRIVILTLPRPLTENTYVRLGPIKLEDHVIAEDSEPVIVEY